MREISALQRAYLKNLTRSPGILLKKEHFHAIRSIFGRDAVDIIGLELAYVELGWDKPLAAYKRQAGISDAAWSRIVPKLPKVFKVDQAEGELIIPHLINNMRNYEAKVGAPNERQTTPL